MRRLRNALRPDRPDEDLEAELRTHLEMAAQAAAGERPARDAARDAALRYGAMAQAMEALRDQRGLPWLADLARDGRHALRSFWRTPAFALAAVLSIACALAASTAVFSVADAVLLRTLPVDRPGDLVFLDTVGSEGHGGAPPYPCVERLRRETGAFAGIAAFATDELKLELDGGVEQVFGQLASGNYFQLLGVKPAVGRLLQPLDEGLDPAVAVLGYDYWQRRFGGDPGALGRTVTFDHRTFTIVGVTARGFRGLDPGRNVDVTVPITINRTALADAGDWWFDAVARLRPGLSSAQADAQADAVFQSFMGDRQLSGLRSRRFAHLEVAPASRGLGTLRSRFSRPIGGLALVTGIVLLLGCANLGSLLLVRGAARAHEFAVRVATGAGASRLLRQLLTETTLLFLSGAALAVPLAHAAVGALAASLAGERRPVHLDAHVDWRSMLFASGVALAAALGTGLYPALQACRVKLLASLRDGEGRLVGSRRLGRITRLLVVAQAAASFVLLATALLFARTIEGLRAVDLGFDARHVVTMSIDAVLPDEGAAQTRERIWADVLTRVRALPGVRAASLSAMTPLSGRDSNAVIDVPGFASPDESDRIVHVNHVSDGYFDTFRIPLRAGRAFGDSEARGPARVVVLNEAAARAWFPAASPVGASVRFGASEPYRVIGIVGDAKHSSVRETAPRFAYVPLWTPLHGYSRVTLAVDSDRPAGPLVRAIVAEVRSVHPLTLVSEVIGVEQQIDATLLGERLLAALGAAFAVLALGLMGIGVYGVVSYSAALRRPELGLRLTLGASPARIAWSVVRDALGECAIGAAIGLPLALGLAHAARALLFGVDAGDPATYLAVAGMLGLVACAAALGPGWRVWSLDCAETLRRG